MNNSDFNISKEWAFIFEESINKAPKLPLSEPLIQTRELLLKAQVILEKYEHEKNINKKENLKIEYNFTKNLYCDSICGGLN